MHGIKHPIEVRALGGGSVCFLKMVNIKIKTLIKLFYGLLVIKKCIIMMYIVP